MQKVTKEINLVSIKDNHLKTRYEAAVFTTGDTHVVTYENATPVHSDLAAAVQRLSDHVLKISGITAKPDHIHISGIDGDKLWKPAERPILLPVFISAATNMTISTCCWKSFRVASVKFSFI